MGIDPFSACVTRVTALNKGTRCKKLGTATAFYFRYQGACYLISNWHVFTARNPDTNAFLDPCGFEPDELQAHVHMRPQYRLNDENGDPLWFVHPKGRTYDIAALEVSSPDAGGSDVWALPLDGFTAPADLVPLRMGIPLFVLGYPLEEEFIGNLPIWKQATLASEPTQPIEGKPCFLVDTASRPGMSGAPVLLRDINVVKLAEKGFNAGGVTRFVGVYSGRYERDEVHLGRVWPDHLVREMLDARQRAEH